MGQLLQFRAYSLSLRLIADKRSPAPESERRERSNSEAITRALEEVVANNEVEVALRELIRKGRGRFVDVYQESR